MAGKWVVNDPVFTDWNGEYPEPERFPFRDALALEKVTGLELAQVVQGEGGLKSTMGLLWLSMKQVHKDITFGDLDDIDMGAVEQVEVEDEEESTEPDVDSENPTSAPEDTADVPA